MNWLALSYSISSKGSSSSRVTLWRRLQRLGALALTGAYVLPEQSDCLESFTWLAQEIESAGGEALIMKVEQFEGLSDKDLVERFNASRSESYSNLITELDTFAKDLKTQEDTLKSLKALNKYKRQFTELRRIDFFDSPKGTEVAELLTKLEQDLSPLPSENDQVTPAKKKDYQNKTWVTRPQPHVDRLASIWLIKRFIDPKAKIVYRKTAKKDEVSFDMEKAIFGHVGSLCTFETLIASFNLKDAALKPLIQIVHEMDLKDERYVRSEVAGLDAILDGWLASKLKDEVLEQQGIHLFEGLYTNFRNS